MSIAFTICSNNYLAQAKTLGDSIKKYNPDCIFVIGLVDQLNDSIDYSIFNPFLIVPVDNIGIENFDALWRKYNIIELNTCVKASFFKYLFNRYPGDEKIIYFDPDMVLYQPLTVFENELNNNDIIITPHILSPIHPDGLRPEENDFLNYGLYNLGFIGLTRNTMNPGSFLDWWEFRTLNYGFNDVLHGLFVDQLWINYAPIFFDKVKILRGSGFNVAPWNLHERTILEERDENILMKDGSPLIFYHFSTYNFYMPEKMSLYERYTFKTNPELIKLYETYHKKLIENNIESFSRIPCEYILKRERYLKLRTEEEKPVLKKDGKLKRIVKLFVPPIFLAFKKYQRQSSKI